MYHNWFTPYPVETIDTPADAAAPEVAVEAVTAPVREIEPAPAPAPIAETVPAAPQSQPTTEARPWDRPVQPTVTEKYLNSAEVSAMLGVTELELIARSDFAGGSLLSVDLGCGRLYRRSDVLEHLRAEAEGVKPGLASESITSGELYLAPCNC